MSFFQSFTSGDMAALFDRAEHTICFAGPGLQPHAAAALVAAAARIGPELITVCLDFDERVLRMGFGHLDAVKALKNSGIKVATAPGLRMGLAVADDVGFSFTPTALYLEGEDRVGQGMNAMRLSPEQVKETLARLSPAAKQVAILLAKTGEEKQRLSHIEVEIQSRPIEDAAIEQIEKSIRDVPLLKFDVARQVRVYNARLQYVEVELRNASIERRRVAIPKTIQKLGGEELEGRLRTTFDLIENSSALSSKPLVDKLTKLRRDFTPSLGKKFGRMILKSSKDDFNKRICDLRNDLTAHQENVKALLQEHLDNSLRAIVEHFAPIAERSHPDAMTGRFGQDAKGWLHHELMAVFPSATVLVQKMSLECYYKDVTFEDLQDEDFLDAVRKAFPSGDWDKAHDEIGAASGKEHDQSIQ